MRSIVAVVALLLAMPLAGRAGEQAMDPTLKAAYEMFYNGRFAEASAATAELCGPTVAALPACELRTAALHFQIRRAMGDAKDRKNALAQCASCADLLATFVAETRRAQETARAGLKAAPGNEDTQFLLGKVGLNYVWLQLGTLDRKTGWDDYWEARNALDSVLKANPGHVRAKVARAWVDYVVDTGMPRGTRWILGGGNRKRGMQAMRDAAAADSTTFVRAEAGFALWNMQVREKDMDGARATARMLANDYPTNPDLRKFLDAPGTTKGLTRR